MVIRKPRRHVLRRSSLAGISWGNFQVSRRGFSGKADVESAVMTNLKTILVVFVLAASLTVFAQRPGGTQKASTEFTVVETGIPEIQAALKSGKLASRDLVIQYLTRIALYEHKLHAAIAI